MWRWWLDYRGQNARGDASASPVFGSLEGIVCSTKGRAWDGSVGSDRIGMGCSGVDRIPRWCWICLRMVVCWVWVAIICSWWARRAVICWVRMLWEVANAWKVWHRPLYSEMDIAILGSDEGDGSNMGGITGGVRGVAWGAEGATSSIGSAEGTAGAGAVLSAGISTGCGFSGCSGCGISGCSGPVGAPWSGQNVDYVALWVITTQNMLFCSL